MSERVIEAIRKNLDAFGYEGLTFEQVKVSYDKAMSGKKPENIIDMMTATQLKENGLL